MYKINLHAHTYFSDGVNSPFRMAVEAKELGFSALVLTDHYYCGRHPEIALFIDKRRMLKRACIEAKEILPVINGIELAFGGEEMLVFGGEMINHILRHCDEGFSLSVELLSTWKKRFNSAFILCHPQSVDTWTKLLPILDGYELYNSGDCMFLTEKEYTSLRYLPSWCNSDAHAAISLNRGWNIVDTKIETEVDLINYIKRKKQPTFSLDKE